MRYVVHGKDQVVPYLAGEMFPDVWGRSQLGKGGRLSLCEPLRKVGGG